MTALLPSIRVEGLFRVPIYDSELREQLRKYYFRGNAVRDIGDAVQTFIESCMALVLFELTLNNLDDRFRVGDVAVPKLRFWNGEMEPGRAWSVMSAHGSVFQTATRKLVHRGPCG